MTKSIRSKSKRRFRAIRRRRSFKQIKDQLIKSTKKSEENPVSSEQLVDSISNHMDSKITICFI